jgi:hypothetical protein
MVPSQLETPNSGTLPVVFTAYSGTNSFGDDDSTFDGVCQVCHTATSYHLNTTLGAAHDHTVDCRGCHTHDGGFAGAGSCVSCHSAGGAGTTGPNLRRAVVEELGYTSHHIQTVADTTAACQTCHDQSGHKAGSVVLFVQGGSPVTLSGDPLTSAAAAGEAQAVCLACHDETRPTDPFGDGNSPTQAATSAEWSGASHKTAAGGTCFDCHGSGHGSRKQGLLRGAGDFTSAANATTNYEAEEGLCFGCHTSGGTAGTDIEAGYATTVNWMDGTTLYGPSNLNDRHDVDHGDQTTTGRVVECVNCHNPHADSPAWKLRADPDPGDGRVPGTGWFADSLLVENGRAEVDPFSRMTEWCLDCHDGSFPSGVVDGGATPIVDILHGAYGGGNGTSWYDSQMGGLQSGAALKSGTNYWTPDMTVTCTACHNIHPGITPQATNPQGIPGGVFNNLFQLVDEVLGTDFSTSIPPDGTPAELTSLTVRRDDTVNAYYWCNTCHVASMGSRKANCFECHTHADGRF